MGSRGSPVAVTCQHPCYRYPHGHQAQLGIVLRTICCHGALEPPPVVLRGRRFCSQSRPSPSPASAVLSSRHTHAPCPASGLNSGPPWPWALGHLGAFPPGGRLMRVR